MRSMTSSCVFTIGWWSVTSRLIDRWVKSMLRLARREIMADEITTVPEGGKLKMIDPTRTILTIYNKRVQKSCNKKMEQTFLLSIWKCFLLSSLLQDSFFPVWQEEWSYFRSLHPSSHLQVCGFGVFTLSLHFSMCVQSSAVPSASPPHSPLSSISLLLLLLPLSFIACHTDPSLCSVCAFVVCSSPQRKCLAVHCMYVFSKRCHLGFLDMWTEDFPGAPAHQPP